jgi:tetratricopeptide (TPR) repeat protein
MKKLMLIAASLIIFSSICSAAALTADAKWVKYGNGMYAKNSYDQAIAAYQKALSINPANYSAALYCGYAYLKKGDNGNAVNYLERANAISPSPAVEEKIDNIKKSGLKLNIPGEESGIEQSDSENPFRFGIKAGFSLTDVSLSNNTDPFDSKTGISTGLVVAYGFGGLLSMQAELLYSQKGYKVRDFNEFIRFDYIELPLMLKISLSPFKKVLTGIYAGASAGLIVSAKGVNNYDLSKDVEAFDYGAIFGADISYPIVFGRLFLDLRCGLGMANIAKNSGDTKLTNFALTASLGYLF